MYKGFLVLNFIGILLANFTWSSSEIVENEEKAVSSTVQFYQIENA